MKGFLPAQEVKNLKAAHSIERDRKEADRIKTVLALNEGLSYEQVAKNKLQNSCYSTQRQSEGTRKHIGKWVLLNYSKTTTTEEQGILPSLSCEAWRTTSG